MRAAHCSPGRIGKHQVRGTRAGGTEAHAVTALAYTDTSAGSDDSEASETSEEENDDQDATGTHTGTMGRRSQWTKTEQQAPLQRLRDQEQDALVAKNTGFHTARG